MNPSAPTPGLDDVKALIERVASLLLDQRYADAHGLLTGQAARQFTPESLARQWRDVVGDSTTTALMPEITAVDAMEDAPGRQAGDLGWGYVPVVGEDLNEAVAGVVQITPAGLRLRTLELGRP